VEHGWRLKRIHKFMVMSQTYRQQSTRRPECDAIDPENRWLSRYSVRRLDAEEIRDTMLAVSDRLRLEIGGSSVPVCEDGEGRATIGLRILEEGLFHHVQEVGDIRFRRSLYLQSKRTLPLNMLETFDMPPMTPNCDARRCSTVATQALLFLNDVSVIQSSDDLGDQLWSSRSTNAERFELLFLRLFGKQPTADEFQQCEVFFQNQRTRFAQDPNPEWVANVAKSPHAPDVRAMASLCQVLMASNRFLYVD
jgi:Protein of unknown function (DUF1553)